MRVLLPLHPFRLLYGTLNGRAILLQCRNKMTLANDSAARVTVRTSNKKVMRAAVVRSARAHAVVGDTSAYTTMSASWNVSTLPRSIRARSITAPRKAPKPGRATPPSPGSPHQAVAVNPATGRMALGPWAGPFAAAAAATKPTPEPSLPETLYMDGAGLVHYGLSAGAHEAVLRTLRALQDAEAASTQTAKLNTAIAAMLSDRAAALRATRKAGARAAPAARRPPGARRGHAAVQCMHLINQPRGSYY